VEPLGIMVSPVFLLAIQLIALIAVPPANSFFCLREDTLVD